MVSALLRKTPAVSAAVALVCAAAICMAVVAGCSGDKVNKSAGTRVAALEDSAWDASQWISAADAPVVTGEVSRVNQRAADGASWFALDLVNERRVTSAKWMTAGLGVYSLWVNGVPIGEEILKPGFTHYAKTKRSFTYDVTDAVVTGAGRSNVFSARVTPGWWADKVVTPSGHDGMVGRKCAFRSVLELTFDDGSRRLYGTNAADWRAGLAGRVKHAAIYDGEEFDAREIPGYEALDRLGVPEVNTEFAGEILPSEGAEVYFREDLAMAPVRAYVWEGVEGESADAYGKVIIKREFAPWEKMTVAPGETLVVDFGQNAAGVPAFEFEAQPGTKLVCLPSELLNDGNGAKSRGMDGPEGSCHRLNLRTPDQGMRIWYTFGDEPGYVSWRPACSFFGYRLVSVTADAPVSIRSIRSVPVTSITAAMETGRVTTGDSLVNKLISNIRWGQLSNYLSVPTDCPQRDEREGWMADTQVFAETGTFFADTKSFFHKWMRDVRDSQAEDGAYPGVAPGGAYGESLMRIGWADAGVIVPWTVWKQFGDIGIIDESWESMERFMSVVSRTRYSHQALVRDNGNYQWADWLSYEPLESHGGGAFTTDAEGRRTPRPEAVEYWNYLGAAYWILDAEMMREMAAATGRDADKYARMASTARDYARDRFLDDDGTFRLPILNTMQTPALFALRCGLVEGEARDNVIARLKGNFAEHGGCLQTGFLGTSILMKTLTDNGMADIAYELLFQRKNPSWLYSVDNGATTIWERWNSYTLTDGMGPKGMNSFNHYAYGCVGAWIWETVCGIATDTDEPGFRHIVMRPVPDRRLSPVKAEYKSASGDIRSEWEYSGDTWVWKVSVPQGVRATVTLPGETDSRDYGPGEYTFTKELPER